MWGWDKINARVPQRPLRLATQGDDPSTFNLMAGHCLDRESHQRSRHWLPSVCPRQEMARLSDVYVPTREPDSLQHPVKSVVERDVWQVPTALKDCSMSVGGLCIKPVFRHPKLAANCDDVLSCHARSPRDCGRVGAPLVWCLTNTLMKLRGHFGCRQGAMTCRGDRRSPLSGGHHARKSNAADGQKDPQICKRICETPH